MLMSCAVVAEMAMERGAKGFTRSSSSSEMELAMAQCRREEAEANQDGKAIGTMKEFGEQCALVLAFTEVHIHVLQCTTDSMLTAGVVAGSYRSWRKMRSVDAGRGREP